MSLQFAHWQCHSHSFYIHTSKSTRSSPSRVYIFHIRFRTQRVRDHSTMIFYKIFYMHTTWGDLAPGDVGTHSHNRRDGRARARSFLYLSTCCQPSRILTRASIAGQPPQPRYIRPLCPKISRLHDATLLRRDTRQ